MSENEQKASSPTQSPVGLTPVSPQPQVRQFVSAKPPTQPAAGQPIQQKASTLGLVPINVKPIKPPPQALSTIVPLPMTPFTIQPQLFPPFPMANLLEEQQKMAIQRGIAQEVMKKEGVKVQAFLETPKDIAFKRTSEKLFREQGVLVVETREFPAGSLFPSIRDPLKRQEAVCGNFLESDNKLLASVGLENLVELQCRFGKSETLGKEEILWGIKVKPEYAAKVRLRQDQAGGKIPRQPSQKKKSPATQQPKSQKRAK